jgi:hypothetical protein
MSFSDFDNMPISWADDAGYRHGALRAFRRRFRRKSHLQNPLYRPASAETVEIPNFEGAKEDSSEGHLEQIQAKMGVRMESQQQVTPFGLPQNKIAELRPDDQINIELVHVFDKMKAVKAFILALTVYSPTMMCLSLNRVNC